MCSLFSFSQTDNCSTPTTYSGEATWYEVDESSLVNCGYDLRGINPFYIGAINTPQHNNSEGCGACMKIKGPDGEVSLRIVDKCPGCQHGDIDLSREAFQQIAKLDDGRVPITWQYIPCPYEKISLRFKDGSTQWWLGVQTLNHKYRVASIEGRNSSSQYVHMDQQDFNFYIKPGGFGVPPLYFRVTDVHGHAVEIKIDEIPFEEEIVVPTDQQFPECTILSTTEVDESSNFYTVAGTDILLKEADDYQLKCFDATGKEIINHSFFGNEVSLKSLEKNKIYYIQLASKNQSVSFSYATTNAY